MTDACNMRCSYCYLGNKKSMPGDEQTKKIDVEFAKRGLEDFFSESQSRSIRYFGAGEPTLEFERIQQIQEYAKELTGELYTELQTNGFFGNNVARWCAKNVDIIWISMDGIPHVHDHCRKTTSGSGTSKIIENNIKYLAENGITVGIRSTIGSMNIDRQKENIDYFDSLGVKAVFADHLCLPVTNGNNGTKEKISINIDEIHPIEFADRFLDAKKYAEDKGVFYSNFLCVNFDEKVDISCRAMIPAPHLTPGGYVSCCDMVTGTEGILGELIYGKYDEDSKKIIYDQDKINRIRSRNKANLPECRTCEVIDNCAGACMGEAINETKNFYGVKKNFCEVIKYLAKKMPRNNGLFEFLHS